MLCFSQASRVILSSLLALIWVRCPALSQSAGEAGRTIAAMQDDPQGFTWMLVCVGLILTCAITLITVTAVYAFKGKKRV